MIGRRELFGAAAASVALVKVLDRPAGAAAAQVGSQVGSKNTDWMQPRGVDGRLTRLETLDLESQQDFTAGFRLMQNKGLRAASYAAFDRALAKLGLPPKTLLTAEQVRAIADAEPLVNVSAKAWLTNQHLMWKTLQDHFHANSDHYLSELEAGDRSGPGSLELNPKLQIPDYARHEIHIQPGGYVGDPFAGYIYHYGTNSFYVGISTFYTGMQLTGNNQDQVHEATASRLPIPADAKVNRILDMGCGIGQLTVALQERFPEAEVWGIDVGAPMVRYAHYRGNRLGSKANFAQRLAEDTRFPDNYFDLTTSYIMHHEMPADISRKVIAEAQRVTRPGGVFYPIDFISGGTRAPAHSMYARWWDHRWNNEVWTLDFHAMDFSAEIAQRGFTMPAHPVEALPGLGARYAIRTA
jgi:ubiquinone/menaquinone biosynthesis C-methylase UbiE